MDVYRVQPNQAPSILWSSNLLSCWQRHTLQQNHDLRTSQCKGYLSKNGKNLFKNMLWQNIEVYDMLSNPSKVSYTYQIYKKLSNACSCTTFASTPITKHFVSIMLGTHGNAGLSPT